MNVMKWFKVKKVVVHISVKTNSVFLDLNRNNQLFIFVVIKFVAIDTDNCVDTLFIIHLNSFL